MPLSRRFRCSILLTVLSLFASTAQGVAPSYTLTDQGTLSGETVSKADALNNLLLAGAHSPTQQLFEEGGGVLGRGMMCSQVEN